ncbi:MAG: putative activity regulator of membrane protease YbbK [Candidatus Jettenia ecosi]|uniref:Putative activity regulator of membrane protease YbbK n=1 Tax=Candidatus Jettenia ecosi TaxID=2494326 RepID=A0A533Q7T2_9BACT|nr:MAG: putative activity regulator of membrane protease YbbK [Candidatus Jettenia ecosi]
MPVTVWWIWMVFAAIFIISEIFTAGFFLLWFGIGAVVAGILAVLGMSAGWQWGVFIGISAVLFITSRRFAERFTIQQPSGVGADRFLGEKGIVLEEIDAIKNTGIVRIRNEHWRSDSYTNETIPVGKRVEVVKVVGTHLVVKILSEEE